jgi:hypothetical protein
MSKSTTDLTIAVQDYGTDTHIAKQYGMRYPDGTIRWVADKIHASDYGLDFKSIALGVDNADKHWKDRLKKRAAMAQIDPAEYADNHLPLTRTVIVVITEAEVA